MALTSVAKTTPKKATLKRHVKTRKFGLSSHLGARNVMNTVSALGDNRKDCCQPGGTGINHFQTATGHEARVVNSKNDGVKDGLVFSIEGTIDEDIVL